MSLTALSHTSQPTGEMIHPSVASADVRVLDTYRESSHNVRVHEVAVNDGETDTFRARMTRIGMHAVFSCAEHYLRKMPSVDQDSKLNLPNWALYRTDAMRSWASLMPSAKALYPLQRPDDPTLPNGTSVDAFTREMFRHTYDGIGLRTRARIMETIAANHAADRSDQGRIDMRWISLACGAAVPVLDAMQRVKEVAPNVSVDLQLVDFDDDALEFADNLAQQQGLVRGVDYSTANVNLARELIVRDTLVETAGEESFDMVDMLGIFEYFDAKRSSAMLRNAYRLVKPGGQMVIGNMLMSHPNLEVNKRAVGWPKIHPRTLDQILAITTAAGIPSELIDVYIPEDNVYAVVSMRKEATERPIDLHGPTVEYRVAEPDMVVPHVMGHRALNAAYANPLPLDSHLLA